MRLHRLQMTAFGPFAGTETIDVDAMSASGLFLLHGPTGAGKTTVLDAVCFALFGHVPGARGSARQRLRSDHAPADREPRVLLELTVAGRRLEIVRTPEWQRPKRRGSGTTKAQATTTVRELVDGEWVALTSRNDEAGHLLQQLIGMGVDQFTKVVLLPQGDFAAFLRSDAETRRALLSRLFEIDQYTGVEAWLTEERRRLGREVEASDRRTSELVSRANEAAAGLPQLASPSDVTSEPGVEEPAKPLLVVAGLLDHAEVAVRAGEALLVQCGEQLTSCRHELSSATALVDLQRRWTTATRRRAELESAAPLLDEQRATLAAARRAAPLGPLLAAQGEVRERWTTSAQRLVTARSHPSVAAWLNAGLATSSAAVERVSDCDDDLDARHEALLSEFPPASEVEQRRSDLQGRRSALQSAVARLPAVEQALVAVERLTAAAERATSARRGAQEALDRAHRLVERAAADLDVRGHDLPDVAPHEAALERSRVVLRHAHELATVIDQARHAERRHLAAVDADQAAREHYLDVRQHRLDGIAGELAAVLRDGEPCAVCGSRDHPAPAPRGDGAVDASVEDAAASAAEQARVERVAAATTRSQLQSRTAELSALTGGLGVEAAREAVHAAQAQLEHAIDARRLFDQALAARAEATAEVQRLSMELAEHTARHVEAEAALSEARGRLASINDEVRAVASDGAADWPASGDVADLRGWLSEAVVTVSAELSAVEELWSARAQLVAVHTEHAALRRRVESTAIECGFGAVAEAAAALMAPTDLAQLAAAVDLQERQRLEVDAELARAELLEASHQPAPDLPAVQQALDVADARLRRATAEHAVADRAASALRTLHAQLSAHELASDDLRQRYARVDELSRCVDGTGGGNVLRMRLSAYVLAARLEQVAAAATERLDAMSGGRYALMHTDELVKGGGRSGLALRVVDSWTGVERDTATLSGGESFLASLALALGLADVVQAEAGGASIETLFVDEGFGTLDDDTLDEVMAVLDALRDGGRTIGVVSHVAELRQRIPNRVEVVKRRDGSRLVAHDVNA